MDPTEREFRERLDSMERDDEVPTNINPETISERNFYYLLIKRCRTVSDIELLNHMYGALQAIGNQDVDTMNRYIAAKRKGTRIIQKCNELLDAMKKKTDSSPEKLKGLSVEKIPKKSSKKDSMAGQEGSVLPFSSKSQTVPEEGYENLGSSRKREGPIRPTGGFGVCPDSGERGQEREEALKIVQEITKGNREMTSMQGFGDSAFYPRGGNSYFGLCWK